ncbi:MAG: TonB-dependent receptor, partial [Bacteroidetes bacterium]|nr:TonB-dependent receptor [Bacteroidota bacterium]
ETDVINAKGRAYGGEFLIKKKSGKLNGWVSYTYARSLVQANGPYPEEVINQGEFYPSNFDRPHNLSLIMNYKFTRRINISLNTTYSTGRPTTLPVATYQFNNISLPFFSNRNQYRIPDYFRMDLGINIEGNHKVRKFLHSSWSFSIYNLTGRNNAYSVFSRIEKNEINTYQLSIFSRAIPTVTYNFQLR